MSVAGDGSPAARSSSGDRWRFAALLACLALSLALYLGLAVILGSVPSGWNSRLGFSLASAEPFRAFTRLPALTLTAPGFERATIAILALLWGCWGASVLAFRGLAITELRRRAALTVVIGGAAMLLLVVVCAPPTLSADLFRQAAYGRMVAHHGLNPYATPVNAIPHDPVFALADHPHLTTHYGPAYTLLSALAAAVAPSTALGAALAWKAMSAGAALGCALLAARVARALGGTNEEAEEAQLWLAWNPLLILESADAGHIEPIMIFAALAGILVWQRGRQLRGVIVLVVSTLTKWVSGLVLLFAIARETHHAAPKGKLRTTLRLTATAGLATALLYLPFAGGLTKRGGISDLALRGSATVGAGAQTAVPQWALLAGFAILVLGTVRYVARGDWQRLIATTAALTLVFVTFVNPWPFPWYFVTPLVLAATLPRGRAGFVLRGLTAGIGAVTLFMYAKLTPWP
jgi:hypothetical protein